jgi:hypothetical protein
MTGGGAQIEGPSPAAVRGPPGVYARDGDAAAVRAVGSGSQRSTMRAINHRCRPDELGDEADGRGLGFGLPSGLEPQAVHGLATASTAAATSRSASPTPFPRIPRAISYGAATMSAARSFNAAGAEMVMAIIT